MSRVRPIPRSSDPAHEELGGYTTVLAIYGAATSMMLLVASRRGKLPGRFRVVDLAMFGIAAHKLARTVATDAVTRPIRAPFTDEATTAAETPVEVPARTGWRKPLGELFTCPFCLGQWSATAFVVGSMFAPAPARAVASILVVRSVSDWLQLGFGGLERLATGGDEK